MPLSHSQTLEGFGCGGAGGGQIGSNVCHKRKMDFFGYVNCEDMHDPTTDKDLCESLPKKQCLWPQTESQPPVPQSPQDSLPGCLKDDPPLSAETLASLTLSSSFLSSSLPQSIIAPTPHVTGNNLADYFLSRIHRNQREEEQRMGLNNTDCQQRREMEGEEVTMEEEKDLISADHSNVKNHNNNNDSHQGRVCDNSLEPASYPGDNEVMEANLSMDSDCVRDSAQYTSPQSGSSATSAPRSIMWNTDKRCGFAACRGLRPSPVSGRLYCHCSASWRGMYGLEAGYINDYY